MDCCRFGCRSFDFVIIVCRMVHRAQPITSEPCSASAPPYPIPIDCYHDHEKHSSIFSNLLSFLRMTEKQQIENTYAIFLPVFGTTIRRAFTLFYIVKESKANREGDTMTFDWRWNGIGSTKAHSLPHTIHRTHIYNAAVNSHSTSHNITTL